MAPGIVLLKRDAKRDPNLENGPGLEVPDGVLPGWV